MRKRKSTTTLRLGVLVGVLVAVTGCASTDARSGSPGMSMSPVSSTIGARAEGARPSETASMVCGDEIHHDVQQTLGLPTLARGSSTWSDRLFTCSYRTPAGPLVLSVQDAMEPAAGHAYFTALRTRIGPMQALQGLAAFGLPSYESSTGQVIFLKDGKTLDVDATALRTVSGPDQLSPSDVAYAVAADVIGCWSE